LKPKRSLLAVILLLLFATTAYATEVAPTTDEPTDDVVMYNDITDVMQPYLDVVARINSKYKLNITVPHNSMQDIYECIGNDTPDVFEAMLDKVCAENLSDAASVEGETPLIYVLLRPYQAVIDKLNVELGTTMTIPDSNKYDVYRAYKDMTAEQVEARLRFQLNPNEPAS